MAASSAHEWIELHFPTPQQRVKNQKPLGQKDFGIGKSQIEAADEDVG